MNNTSKLLAAFAIGAAAGAVAGILLAPGKGSDTRRRISEEGKKLAGDIKKRYEEAKEKFECLKKDMEEAGEPTA